MEPELKVVIHFCKVNCHAQKRCLHETVKTALVKDGWTITHVPLALKFGEQDVFIDLGAEAPIAAEKADARSLSKSRAFWVNPVSRNWKRRSDSTFSIAACCVGKRLTAASFWLSPKKPITQCWTVCLEKN